MRKHPAVQQGTEVERRQIKLKGQALSLDTQLLCSLLRMRELDLVSEKESKVSFSAVFTKILVSYEQWEWNWVKMKKRSPKRIFGGWRCVSQSRNELSFLYEDSMGLLYCVNCWNVSYALSSGIVQLNEQPFPLAKLYKISKKGETIVVFHHKSRYFRTCMV